MSNKNKSLLILLLLALLLAACGDDDDGDDDLFRVAVIMPSNINDLAFSQSMYNALTTIQKEMGGEEKMELVYSEGMFVVDDAAAAIRDYASQGYDLVIAHGSQYGSSLREIAPDFEKTSFAWGTTVDTFADAGIKNVFAYEAASDQGGYVNGVMAGLLTQSNVVGVVGPIETGAMSILYQKLTTFRRKRNVKEKQRICITGAGSDFVERLWWRRGRRGRRGRWHIPRRRHHAQQHQRPGL